MIAWLLDWWDNLDPQYLYYCAIASVLIVGTYTCAMMPPQVVTDRFRTLQRVEHSSCVGYDSKGNCSSWHHWTTIEPQWVLVDEELRECEVLQSTYQKIRRGQEKKCYQLFGWHGGVHSLEFPILEKGW
jgi:hypothetical protein